MGERIITEDALSRFEWLFTLEQKKFDDGSMRYRWRRSDGVVVSPEIESAEVARDWPTTHGFVAQAV